MKKLVALALACMLVLSGCSNSSSSSGTSNKPTSSNSASGDSDKADVSYSFASKTTYTENTISVEPNACYDFFKNYVLTYYDEAVGDISRDAVLKKVSDAGLTFVPEEYSDGKDGIIFDSSGAHAVRIVFYEDYLFNMNYIDYLPEKLAMCITFDSHGSSKIGAFNRVREDGAVVSDARAEFMGSSYAKDLKYADIVNLLNTGEYHKTDYSGTDVRLETCKDLPLYAEFVDRVRNGNISDVTRVENNREVLYSAGTSLTYRCCTATNSMQIEYDSETDAFESVSAKMSLYDFETMYFKDHLATDEKFVAGSVLGDKFEDFKASKIYAFLASADAGNNITVSMDPAELDGIFSDDRIGFTTTNATIAEFPDIQILEYRPATWEITVSDPAYPLYEVEFDSLKMHLVDPEEVRERVMPPEIIEFHEPIFDHYLKVYIEEEDEEVSFSYKYTFTSIVEMFEKAYTEPWLYL